MLRLFSFIRSRAVPALIGAGLAGQTLVAASDSLAQQLGGAPLPRPGTVYHLHSVFRGTVECLQGNDPSSPVHDGAAFMESCQNVAGQRWTLERVGALLFRLHTEAQGATMCLQANTPTSSEHNGSAFLARCSATIAGQQWRLARVGLSFTLHNGPTEVGRCFHSNAASSAPRGGNAYVETCLGETGEQWMFAAIPSTAPLASPATTRAIGPTTPAIAPTTPPSNPRAPQNAPIGARLYGRCGLGTAGGPVLTTFDRVTAAQIVTTSVSAVELDAHTFMVVFSARNYTGPSLTITSSTAFCGLRYSDGTNVADNVGSARIGYLP
jgi:hypothetical protein